MEPLKCVILCALGMATGQSAECWCGGGKVGVAAATPTKRHFPSKDVRFLSILQKSFYGSLLTLFYLIRSVDEPDQML